MRYQELVSVRDKNINSSFSEVKQYEETIANEQSQNRGGEYQIDEITYTKGGSLQMRTYSNKGKGGWKTGHKIRTS